MEFLDFSIIIPIREVLLLEVFLEILPHNLPFIDLHLPKVIPPYGSSSWALISFSLFAMQLCNSTLRLLMVYAIFGGVDFSHSWNLSLHYQLEYSPHNIYFNYSWILGIFHDNELLGLIE